MHGTHKYSWMALGVASFPHLDAAPAPFVGQIFPESVYLEEPFVWTDSEGGDMIIAKDMDGWVCSEKYTGIRATSRGGRSWLLDGAKHTWNMVIPIDGGIR
ncbi:hypothetical protein ABU162_23700 [Paenibacillus thiaminolyticus]|uniref:hypothetical protein n=1 Tax=Paenibacillus thiaminolyticus TaxID=49283 RepID=UPI0035A59951